MTGTSGIGVRRRHHRWIAVALFAAAWTPARAEPTLAFAFQEEVRLGPTEDGGATTAGRRNRIPLLGGTIEGARIRGEVLPGGSDWQLIRSDGCAEILADYFIRTDDKVLIHVVNAGLACGPKDGRAAYLRANPRFEAPIGRYDWLNRSVFTSTIEAVPGETAVRVRFYEVR